MYFHTLIKGGEKNCMFMVDKIYSTKELNCVTKLLCLTMKPTTFGSIILYLQLWIFTKEKKGGRKWNNFHNWGLYYGKVGMPSGAAWYIWGPKAKIDHLVWDAKLLLINMNYVEFFLFLKNFIDRKNLTKFFILVDVVNW